MKCLILLSWLWSSIAMSQSLPAEPIPPDKDSVLFSFGEEMLRRINYIRGREGLPLLWKSEAAICAASLHGAYLVEKDTCDHQGRPQFPTVKDRLKLCGYAPKGHGETIACGFNTAHSALEGWLKSPRHAKIIRSKDYSQFGVAFLDGIWVLVLLQ